MMDRDFDGAWWRLAFLMLCSQPLLAQAWTAQALVDETLAANPGVDALQQAVAAAAWQVEPAGALDDPQLTYAIAPRSVDAAGIDPGHILGVAQPLPWPGKRAVQRKAAESNVRVAESDLRALRLALSATARQAYAELHYLHGALRINAEQQQRLTELQQATSGRYRAGAGSQHALLRASTRLAERRRQALEGEPGPRGDRRALGVEGLHLDPGVALLAAVDRHHEVARAVELDRPLLFTHAADGARLRVVEGLVPAVAFPRHEWSSPQKGGESTS